MLTIVNLAVLAASIGLPFALYTRHVRIRSWAGPVPLSLAGDGYVGSVPRSSRNDRLVWLRQRERLFTYGLYVVVFGCVLVVCLGTYDLTHSWDQHGHLTPPDAPQAVTVFLAILAGLTAAVAALVGAWEKIIRARGEMDNDRIRAMAEFERARRTGELPPP